MRHGFHEDLKLKSEGIEGLRCGGLKWSVWDLKSMVFVKVKDEGFLRSRVWDFKVESVGV